MYRFISVYLALCVSLCVCAAAIIIQTVHSYYVHFVYVCVCVCISSIHTIPFSFFFFFHLSSSKTSSSYHKTWVDVVTLLETSSAFIFYYFVFFSYPYTYIFYFLVSLFRLRLFRSGCIYFFFSTGFSLEMGYRRKKRHTCIQPISLCSSFSSSFFTSPMFRSLFYFFLPSSALLFSAVHRVRLDGPRAFFSMGRKLSTKASFQTRRKKNGWLRCVCV